MNYLINNFSFFGAIALGNAPKRKDVLYLLSFLFGVSVCLNIFLILIFIFLIRYINKKNIFSLLKNSKAAPEDSNYVVNDKDYDDFVNAANSLFDNFLRKE